MLDVLKLGHAEFEVQDVERMAEFYSNVIGLTETGCDGQTIYLSTSIDHHSIVLRGAPFQPRLHVLGGCYRRLPPHADLQRDELQPLPRQSETIRGPLIEERRTFFSLFLSA